MELRNCAAMVDIETESTQPTAKILSIGAVLFDPYALNSPQELMDGFTFYQNVDPATQPLSHTDPSTLQWWESQSQAARDAVLSDQVPIDVALRQFHQFCVWRGDEGLDHPPAHSMWANDPSFDCVILSQSFEAYTKFRFPVPFYAWRSFRTAKELAWPHPDEDQMPIIQVGVAHNALDDCIKQAMYVQAAYRRFGHHPTARVTTA